MESIPPFGSKFSTNDIIGCGIEDGKLYFTRKPQDGPELIFITSTKLPGNKLINKTEADIYVNHL